MSIANIHIWHAYFGVSRKDCMDEQLILIGTHVLEDGGCQFNPMSNNSNTRNYHNQIGIGDFIVNLLMSLGKFKKRETKYIRGSAR